MQVPRAQATYSIVKTCSMDIQTLAKYSQNGIWHNMGTCMHTEYCVVFKCKAEECLTSISYNVFRLELLFS